jgi:hypothetical protein
MSTRFRWRGRGADIERAELPLRKAVHDYLRAEHPEGPRPPGKGWYFYLTDILCPMSAHRMTKIIVPGYEATGFVLCAECLETEGVEVWFCGPT